MKPAQFRICNRHSMLGKAKLQTEGGNKTETLRQDCRQGAPESDSYYQRGVEAKKQLFNLNTSIPALITGKDLVTITSNMEFSDNKIATIALLDKFCDEMKVLAGQGYHVGNKQSPRVLLTGCPVGERDSKIIDLVRN